MECRHYRIPDSEWYIPNGGGHNGPFITGPVIAGGYTPLYTARVVACSRSELRSGISDEPVREQVSHLAVVPHNPFIQKEYTPTNSHLPGVYHPASLVCAALGLAQVGAL